MKKIHSLPLKDCLSSYDVAVFNQAFKILKQDLVDHYWICNDLKNGKMMYLLFLEDLCTKLISLQKEHLSKCDILELMLNIVRKINHKTLEENFNSVTFSILPD